MAADPHTGRQLEIVSPAWGDVFRVPMNDAIILVDGEDAGGNPMPATIPVHALYHLLQATMEFMIAIGTENYERVLNDVPDEISHRYQMEALKATTVLIALGYGNEGVTVQSMLAELLEDDDDEDESTLKARGVDESIQDLLNHLIEDNETETEL